MEFRIAMRVLEGQMSMAVSRQSRRYFFLMEQLYSKYDEKEESSSKNMRCVCVHFVGFHFLLPV